MGMWVSNAYCAWGYRRAVSTGADGRHQSLSRVLPLATVVGFAYRESSGNARFLIVKLVRSVLGFLISCLANGR